MKIYFACPSGARREGIVKKYGDKYGACLTRDVFNNKTANSMPWCFDNGAFADWNNNESFNHEKFAKRMQEIEFKIRFGYIPEPDFVVVPDIVGEGLKSLTRSIQYNEWLNENYPHNKYYLAVQDGMNFLHIQTLLRRRLFDGVFIGGTKPWKYENSETLVEMAHKHGLPVHIGGIGTRKNILWAKNINADSVDSGVAMIHPGHLKDIFNIESELLWAA